MYLSLPFSKRQSKRRQNYLVAQPEMLSKAELITNEIFRLFEGRGNAISHDGRKEPIAVHMIQCGMLAMEHLSDLPVIIGALLHDIGHLLKPDVDTGTTAAFKLNHEVLGAEYLRRNGFSDRVCAMVAQQTQARRYLATTDTAYLARLTPASLQMLYGNGGPMTADETAAFEKHPYFGDIVNVCYWDEEVKNKRTVLLPLACFAKILVDHLWYRVQ